MWFCINNIKGSIVEAFQHVVINVRHRMQGFNVMGGSKETNKQLFTGPQSSIGTRKGTLSCGFAEAAMVSDVPHSVKHSFKERFWPGECLSLVLTTSKVLCKHLSYPHVLNFLDIPALLRRMECLNFPPQIHLVTLYIEINGAVGEHLTECFWSLGPEADPETRSKMQAGNNGQVRENGRKIGQ